MTPVISSEWTTVLPGSLAFSLGARQVLAQLGPHRGISCDKGEPRSHVHSGIWAFKCFHAILECGEVPLFPLECGRRRTKPAVLRLLFYNPLTMSVFWILDAPPT